MGSTSPFGTGRKRDTVSPLMFDPEPEPDEGAPPALAPRISLLDADPELLAHVSPAEADRARRSVTAPLCVLAEGPFDPAHILVAGRNTFGALIISGLIAREVTVGGQPALRLLGPGDLLHGVPLEAGLLAPEQAWSTSLPTRLALLDDHFLQAVRHWPRLVTALYERAVERHDATLIQMAVSQHPRVEDRLAGLFASLAERWGRVTAHGVAIRLSLTHEALARLVGARRPTVTLALKVLAADGRVQRRNDGAWLITALPAEEPAPLEPLAGKSRPRIVLGPDSEPTDARLPPAPLTRELLLRAQQLAAGQRRLCQRAELLGSRNAHVRRETRALLELTRAGRAERAERAKAR
jgi:CRP-like cAMP-binding protein